YSPVSITLCILLYFHFFITNPPSTEIYTLSLHDALPIYLAVRSNRIARPHRPGRPAADRPVRTAAPGRVRRALRRPQAPGRSPRATGQSWYGYGRRPSQLS